MLTALILVTVIGSRKAESPKPTNDTVLRMANNTYLYFVKIIAEIRLKPSGDAGKSILAEDDAENHCRCP